MADKRNEHDIFDTDQEHSEFHFADDEETPVYAEEARPVAAPKKNGLWQKLRKNKIFLVIGVLVVIYFAYQLIELFSGSPEQAKKQLVSTSPTSVPNTSVVPLPTQQSAQIVPQQQTPNLNAAVTNVQQSQQADTARLAALEQQSGNFSRAITALQQQAVNNANQIQAIQIQLNNIDRSLLMLAQELKKPNTAAKKPAAKAKAAVPAYYVKAIIPGRAWLTSSNGTTITVSPGDTIPSFGRVTDIDPDSGTVGTTSGKTIHFGISEH